MNHDIRRRAVLGAALAAPAVSFEARAAAGPAGLQPVEDFFKHPVIGALRMAPGGKHICGVKEINGRFNAVVLDVATRKTLIVTNFKDMDVTGLRWITPDRLVFGVFDRHRSAFDQHLFGVYAINRDAGDFIQLVGVDDPRLLPAETTSIFGRIYENGAYTGEVFAYTESEQAVGRRSSDLKRYNTTTRRATLLTMGGPHDVVEWITDVDNVPRAAVSVRDGITKVHLRDSAQAPWRVIFEYGPEDDGAKDVSPIMFDAEGNLYVSTYSEGSDNRGIFRLRPKASKVDPEPLVAIKGFDLSGGLIFDRKRTRLLGIGYEADRAGTYWIDERLQGLQDQIDRALPGQVNELLYENDEDDIMLVYSYSDRDPGRYYLFTPSKRDLSVLAEPQPWIKPEKMRPTRFYRYAARDGMSIPAQLTLPEGTGRFPLVVLHYGGPWVRPIHWNWDEIVQFLASRGYAVFMPAPRASRGFGAKLFRAGWKQWGLGMQDDVTDGVQDLAKKGLIDIDRVCIAGASYGGYLTMMGLAKEPKLYKCGINWVGVTDPSFMFTVTWTDFNRADSGRYDLPLLVGDPDKDKEQFKRTSPVERAAEIRQPVLMAYGGLDVRVPRVNGDRMRSALEGHNQNVEYVIYPDEGHGWSRLENNIDFWTRVETFLKKNL